MEWLIINLVTFHLPIQDAPKICIVCSQSCWQYIRPSAIVLSLFTLRCSITLSPSRSKPQPSSSRFRVEPIIAFYIFALVNLLAALYSPIQDCDEVYNYWEPTHYLVHKFGLQTWEYSPEFCIRSWLYVSLHAFVVKVASFLVFDKTREFYVLRTVLAIVCAYCESRLFTAISKIFNPRVGIMFMMVMLSSPGMFHASAAYLPSSFTMYTCMMGLVEFLDWRGGSRTHVALVWFGVGGIIGWPFASALAIPLFIQEIVLASITKEGVKLLAKCIDGSVRCMIAVVSLLDQKDGGVTDLEDPSTRS